MGANTCIRDDKPKEVTKAENAEKEEKAQKAIADAAGK